MPLPKPTPYDFSESIDRRANLTAFSSPEPTNTFIFGPEKNPHNISSNYHSADDEEEAERELTTPINRKQPSSVDSSPEPSSKILGGSPTSRSDQVKSIKAKSY